MTHAVMLAYVGVKQTSSPVMSFIFFLSLICLCANKKDKTLAEITDMAIFRTAYRRTETQDCMGKKREGRREQSAGYAKRHPHPRENQLCTLRQIRVIDEAIFMMS